MKISKKILKTMAAGLIFSAAFNSCGKSKQLIHPDMECKSDCDIDHLHKMNAKEKVDEEKVHIYCPQCGLG